MWRILLALYFLSGASGLIYQVVWVREFGNVFGNTTQSAALVVAVFMLGLGVGGLVAGRWADRQGRHSLRPLRAYGYAELAIGVLALLLSFALPALTPLSAAASSYVADAAGYLHLSRGSYLARYAVAVALLAPLTMLMGGTLTLLIRARVEGHLAEAGWKVGVLYGVNTAGAAAGALLTDLALVPGLGLGSTQLLAVVLNLIAGLGALRLASGRAASPATPAPPPPTEAQPRADGRALVALTCAAIFLSGFAAMGFEMVWFRHLSCLFGSHREVFSALLTVVLVGLWLGSMAGGYLNLRLGRPGLLFASCQAALAAVVLGGLLAFGARPLRSSLALGGGELLRVVLLEVGPPALLMGVAFPLANALVQQVEEHVGARAGLVYLANTVGAVLGSLLTGFVLLPGLGLQDTAAALVVVVGLGLVPLGLVTTKPRHRVVAAALAAVVVVSLVAWRTLPPRHLVERSVLPASNPPPVLALEEGLTEVVAVTEDPRLGRTLMTNGHPMSGTHVMAQRYMRAFAHLPLLTLDEPHSVLVICFGVGNTLHAASLHPTVRRLDLAELSESVLRHADYFSATHGGVLKDPRLRVHVNDGRHHLLMQPEGTYDLITLEPPPITFAGVSALYSREFYQLARSRLRPGGQLTQWLPVYQVGEEGALAMVRAFVEVFPQAVLLSGSDQELILLGANADALELDPERVRARLAALPAVRADLERVHAGTLTELVGMFAASPATLAKATADVAPLTDDWPVIEYELSARSGPRRTPAALFDVRDVGAWCPRCFDLGRPVAGLEQLPAYLGVLGRIYESPGFLERDEASGQGGSLTLPGDPETRRALAESAYLRTLLRLP